MAERLRIGVVVPRYHAQITGGAELHAGWLAQHLSRAGHAVEVFTTCALDHYTWRNELPAGSRSEDGLVVHRYPTEPRDLELFGELERAIIAGRQLSREEELLWFRHGVSSRGMEAALAKQLEAFDLFIALPYLFGVTYFAWTVCHERLALVPCLHDEPYARLAAVREMLEGSWGLMFNSPPEVELAQTLAPRLARSSIVALGFDPPVALDPERVRRKYRLPSEFLLYVGRFEEGKNVHELVRNFLTYRQRRPDRSIALILAGSGLMTFPPHADIRPIRIDWKDRDSLYSAATVFCQPSRKESLSIVLMQAWAAGCAVMVDGRAAVPRFHCERSDGGLWYSSYVEFEAVLDRLLADPVLRAALAQNGRRYVLDEYSWEAVLGRFNQAVEDWRKSDKSSVLEER